MTFRVGMKVECIRGPYESWGWGGKHDAVVGQIYTIRAIRSGKRPQYGIGLLLEEIINPSDGNRSEAGFYSSRFRPIVERKTSIEVFQRMLNPSEVEA